MVEMITEMMENALLSVVIPVHNGEKYIKKTVKRLLEQTYSNIEIILVENQSKDHSYEICSLLANKDPRVKVLKSFEKGTSLARRMGVEHSLGDYITFSDQDDTYINSNALSEMISAIIEDNTDICQFSYYKEYAPFLRRKIIKNDESAIINVDSIHEYALRGVLDVHGGSFTTAVWDKIYKAELLKEAATHVNESLFYAEDEYLNIWALTSPFLKTASLRREAFYCWKANIGFSSKHTGQVLLKDYEIVKPVIINLAKEQREGDQYLWKIHGESLFCMRAVIFDMIRQKHDKGYIIQKISEFSLMNYIIEAKEYFRNYPDQSVVWDSLKMMASEITPEEYYEYCCQEVPDRSFIDRVKSLFSKIESTLKQ